MYVNEGVFYSSPVDKPFRIPGTDELVKTRVSTEGTFLSGFAGGNQGSGFSFHRNLDRTYLEDNYSTVITESLYDRIESQIIDAGTIDIANRGGQYFPPGSSVSQILGIPKREYYVARFTDTVFFEENVVCDAKVVFLVPQDNSDSGVRFEDGFRNETLGDACLFVVEEEVYFPTTTESSSFSKFYHSIEAGIISDSQLLLNAETGFGSVRVRGFVVSSEVAITSNTFGGIENVPSLLVEYDPRFRLYFGDLLNTNSYSLREFGL
jgi:hypothetical protein